jgi:hypothetical protein
MALPWPIPFLFGSSQVFPSCQYIPDGIEEKTDQVVQDT